MQTYSLVRSCRGCGSDFQITSSRNAYCEACRTVTCKGCGQPFRRRIGDGNTTCSPTCSATANAAPILTCERCGGSFKQRQGRRMKYCGQECRYLASRADEATTTGNLRRGYRYKQWRRAVFTRDGYTCQHCGATERLHAHHPISWHSTPALRYEVSNGLTLCLDCHARLHGAKVTPVGARRRTCVDCAVLIQGRGTSGRCRSCAMRTSPKALAAQARRVRNGHGQFTGPPQV